jgi:anaerobic ribonucleoside-triphosphate reductase activating protein
MRLNLHSLVPDTTVNGPGRRCLIVVQGCDRGCPGCFNPETHPFEDRTVLSPFELFQHISGLPFIEGITISGGEPVLQAPALVRFLKMIREETDHSVLLFSGLTIEEIRQRTAGPELIALTDILIDGPFVMEKRVRNSLRGSSNQQIHFLSRRYSPADIQMDGDAEIIIRPGGEIVVTGFEGLRV